MHMSNQETVDMLVKKLLAEKKNDVIYRFFDNLVSQIARESSDQPDLLADFSMTFIGMLTAQLVTEWESKNDTISTWDIILIAKRAYKQTYGKELEKIA